MKKRCIAVVLLWVIIACFGMHIRSIAYALDPITYFAGLTFSMGNSLGVFTNVANGTAAMTQTWMENSINEYSSFSGKTLTDIFGTDALIVEAGKLAATQRLANGALEVLNWIVQHYDLSGIETEMGVDGEFRPYEKSEGYYARGASTWLNTYQEGKYTYYEVWVQGYHQEAVKAGTNRADQWEPYGQYFNVVSDTKANVGYYFQEVATGNISMSYARVAIAPDVNKVMMSLSPDYVEPTVLNPNQEWVGDFGAAPDTNLDQLIDSIFEDVADNNLSVDGEVIDIPVPPGPVPTWTPVDDVIDGINQMGEQLDGLGNDIGNISGHLDDIGDQIDGIDQSLEGVQEGIETQTGVISGAIDQAVQDVADAIGEQTATLDETLTETAESVQDIAEALQPGEIEPKKFDLRGLFPFCIPFDIHNLLQKFMAAPVAPHVQLPFVIQSIGFSYTFDLDFSAFDSVAAIMRTVEYIVFAIGLAWATSKVIKW